MPILDKEMDLSEKIFMSLKAVEIDPEYEVPLFNLGLYYKQSNELKLASYYFEKAHFLSPFNEEFLNLLCQTLADLKDYKKLQK